jgi:hypothetical protein
MVESAYASPAYALWRWQRSCNLSSTSSRCQPRHSCQKYMAYIGAERSCQMTFRGDIPIVLIGSQVSVKCRQTKLLIFVLRPQQPIHCAATENQNKKPALPNRNIPSLTPPPLPQSHNTFYIRITF